MRKKLRSDTKYQKKKFKEVDVGAGSECMTTKNASPDPAPEQKDDKNKMID